MTDNLTRAYELFSEAMTLLEEVMGVPAKTITKVDGKLDVQISDYETYGGQRVSRHVVVRLPGAKPVEVKPSAHRLKVLIANGSVKCSCGYYDDYREDPNTGVDPDYVKHLNVFGADLFVLVSDDVRAVNDLPPSIRYLVAIVDQDQNVIHGSYDTYPEATLTDLVTAHPQRLITATRSLRTWERVWEAKKLTGNWKFKATVDRV